MTVNRLPQAQGDIEVFALVKGDERYVFIWYDAAVLSQRIRAAAEAKQ